MARKRRNPKWPFDRPERIEVVDLDPETLYRRLEVGKPCVTCGRHLAQIREPEACVLCQSVVEYLEARERAHQQGRRAG